MKNFVSHSSTISAYWAVEGLGVFVGDGVSLHWPGGDWAILALPAGWFAVSRMMVRALPGVKERREVAA